MKKIGNEIKVRRVKQGIQQTALAEMLDITQTHLSNIENGRVPGSLKLLLKLRSIFGCRLEDLSIRSVMKRRSKLMIKECGA